MEGLGSSGWDSSQGRARSYLLLPPALQISCLALLLLGLAWAGKTGEGLKSACGHFGTSYLTARPLNPTPTTPSAPNPGVR